MQTSIRIAPELLDYARATGNVSKCIENALEAHRNAHDQPGPDAH